MADSAPEAPIFQAFGILNGTLQHTDEDCFSFLLDDGPTLRVFGPQARLKRLILKSPHLLDASHSWFVYPRTDHQGRIDRITIPGKSFPPAPSSFKIVGQITSQEPGKVIVRIYRNEYPPKGDEHRYLWKPFFLTLFGDLIENANKAELWQFDCSLDGDLLRIQSATKRGMAAPLSKSNPKSATPPAQTLKTEPKHSDLTDQAKPVEQNSPPPAAQPVVPEPKAEPKHFDLTGATKPIEQNPPKSAPKPDPQPETQKKQKTDRTPPAQTSQTPAQSSTPVQPPPKHRFRVKANNRVFGGQLSVHLKGGMLQIDGKPVTATKMAIVLGNPDQIGADGTVKRTEQHIILTGR